MSLADNKGFVPHEARKPMVRWYDPRQLMRTALDVFLSTLFGRHADYRVIEALGTPYIDPDDFDYTANSERQEIWIDYVADAGDGWNPTYAIAHAIAQPRLDLQTEQGFIHETERGNILIFGGDAVYPVAGRIEYRQRLLAAYRAALPEQSADVAPHVYAIPGNHDWYDSLVSFTRLFCGRESFAGWKSRQKRSYFALQLPQRWWLLGTDMQLESDIDRAQVDYFQHIANTRMQEGDQVILCNAEPHWISTAIYAALDQTYSESNLNFLVTSVLRGRDVKIFLAGDLHHYRRHADANGTQKITAGGGAHSCTPRMGRMLPNCQETFTAVNATPTQAPQNG